MSAFALGISFKADLNASLRLKENLNLTFSYLRMKDGLY